MILADVVKVEDWLNKNMEGGYDLIPVHQVTSLIRSNRVSAIPISWIRDYADRIDKAFEKWTFYQKDSQEKKHRDMLHAQGTLLLLIDDWLDEVESISEEKK